MKMAVVKWSYAMSERSLASFGVCDGDVLVLLVEEDSWKRRFVCSEVPRVTNSLIYTYLILLFDVPDSTEMYAIRYILPLRLHSLDCQ